MVCYRKNWTTIILIFLVILAIEGYFFRYTIISGFDGMLGDRGDPLFNNLVCEHWYDVFQGDESIKDLRIFYPQKNTLGYSDTLFAYALPYSLLRLFGLDLFRSMQLVLILFHLLGTIGLFWLLNRKFKLGILAALFGAAMFSLANNYFIKSIHTQLLLIGLIPWFFVLIYGFYENLQGLRSERLTYGLLVILVFGLLVLSGFYTAYFTALFLLILFGIWLEYSLWTGEKIIKKIFDFVINNKLEVFVYLISFVFVLLPSFLIYLPVAKEQGPRSFSEVAIFLPRWYDFFNVSFSNLVWGKPLKLFFPDIRGGELSTGFPLGTFLLFLICLFYFSKKTLAKNLPFDRRFPLSISISILFVMLLILRFFDFSLWLSFYTFVPGASALRAIARYNMFLSLPMSIVLAFGAEALILKWKLAKNLKIIFIIFTLSFLLLENTVVATNNQWSIKEQRGRFAGIPLPPKNCKFFAILPGTKNPQATPDYVYQLDAWLIADKFNRQTINGYSGHEPIHWGNLSDPNQWSKYNEGIRSWSQKNNLTNLCFYNQVSNKWIKSDF